MSRIFIIAPGRSGSYWLSALMLAATNLPLTGNPEYFPYDKVESDKERRESLDKIWEGLPIDYVCTSLLPRIGYLDYLKEKGARFIHLKRNIPDNAYSMYRMHFTPGRGFRGKWYHPDPESTENIIRLRGTSNLTDYQLCLWGCLETRAEAKRIKYLGADVFEFDIGEINHPTDHTLLTGLLEWIGVEYDINLAKLMVGKRINVLKRYDKTTLTEIDPGDRKKEEKEFFSEFKCFRETIDESSADLSRDLKL